MAKPTFENQGELWWARDKETGKAMLVRIAVYFGHLVVTIPFGTGFYAPIEWLDLEWIGKYSHEWMPANLYGNEIQQEIKVQ